MVTFNEGRKAITEAKKQKPDLILMDMMMPQFSGAEAIKELKKVGDVEPWPKSHNNFDGGHYLPINVGKYTATDTAVD